MRIQTNRGEKLQDAHFVVIFQDGEPVFRIYPTKDGGILITKFDGSIEILPKVSNQIEVR